MDLLDALTKTTERESGGTTALDRFDFQTCWGVAHLIKLHDKSSDYGIAFEFHDDIIVIDSVKNPSSIDFFQVKSKKKGNWTINLLTKREKSDNGNSLKSSIVGKMLDSKGKFGSFVSELAFVSNQPCNFLDQDAYPCAFSDASDDHQKSLNNTISAEIPSHKPADLKLITYHMSDFSLTSYDEALLGKIVNFIEKHCGLHECNHKGFYLSLIDQCRMRSKNLADTTDIQALLAGKFVTRDDVTFWLQDLVRRTARRPQWAEVAPHLIGPISQVKVWRNGWEKYHLDLISRTDVAFVRLREQIRLALKLSATAQTLIEVVGVSMPHLKSAISTNNLPVDDTYLVGGLLYEYWIDE